MLAAYAIAAGLTRSATSPTSAGMRTVISAAEDPAEYVPRLRQKLAIDDDQWGRLCAEHALPLGWESMEYDEFLRQRRRRMADIIRVAYRQLGGERDSPPLTPPWFLPGAEAVWQRIVDTERALRALVREVYVECFGQSAARRIEGDSAGTRTRDPRTRTQGAPSGFGPAQHRRLPLSRSVAALALRYGCLVPCSSTFGRGI